MPDASDPRGRPFGWGDAFAALPADAPPADGWARIAARLDARAAHPLPSGVASAPARATRVSSRRRRVAHGAGWLGAAAAAALALVVAWPRHDATPVFPKPREAAASAAVARDTVATTTPAAQPRATAPVDAARRPPADPTAIALPKAVQADRKPRYAAAARATPARTAPARAEAVAARPDASGAAGTLDALYAESARLEALLDLARDDRVASAGAALLAVELDAQVAGIDARLAQPGLDGAQRTALWQARVDALRQAAGFESTQRILASQGNGGALLVSVD